MTRIQEKLLKSAKETFHDITPCSSKSSFEECFSVFGRKCFFWFNTADHSTRVLAMALPGETGR